MKLLVLSDIDGYGSIIRRISEKVHSIRLDGVVVCGDLTNFGSLKNAEETLKELSLLGVPILFVPGNCDAIDLSRHDTVNGAVNLHGRCGKINDSIFIGVGGSTRTPFRTSFELSEEDVKETLYHAYNCMKLKSRFILVSHTPPVNTRVDTTTFGIHAGSKVIREFIEKTKPVLVVCGHIHEAPGTDLLGESLILNPGPAYKGFYAIAEVDGNAAAEMSIIR